MSSLHLINRRISVRETPFRACRATRQLLGHSAYGRLYFQCRKKLTIVPGIGFTTNLLLGSKAKTELHKDNEQSKITIKNMLGLAPIYFSFATDVELHYKLSNNFNLMLLPSFKHGIVPTTSNHVVKTYPYNFGLGIGLNLSFISFLKRVKLYM